MNPGYQGRSELPDSLKALFRSVAMMVPDFLLIVQNMMMAEGFCNTMSLSKKITKLFEISRETLSR